MSSWLLSSAKKLIFQFLAIYTPGVENLQVDFLSHQCLDPGEWSLHPEIFQNLKGGKNQVDILASRFNSKLNKFVAKTRDLLAFALEALLIYLTQFKLDYAIPEE